MKSAVNGTMLEDSDQQLVARFQETGQKHFLEVLLARHLPTVRSTVFQMLLDDEVADDVTQEVFLRVVRGIDRFEGRAEFSTWLFRVTLNVVRQHLKSRGRSCVEFHDELPVRQAVSGIPPDGVVLQAELSTAVETALAELSSKLRAAIVLVCLQGLSPATAAEIEGCSRNTMYSRVHEARQQLKKLLAEHLQ